MKADKYSFFVKILKITCSVVVACVLLLLIIFIKTGSFQNIKLTSDKDPSTPTNSTPSTTVANPSFFGLSAEDTEYSLHAEQIIQLNSGQYQLNKIKGKYFLDQANQEYVSIVATNGDVNPTTKNIDLDTNVEIIFSGGYRLLTEQLKINFDTLVASTSIPVTFTGGKGKILAEHGLLLTHAKKTIEFFGPVETILHNATHNNSSTTINSDKLLINYHNKTANFYDNIKVIRKDLVLYCDKITVYTEKESTPQNNTQADSQNIKKIEFSGNIVIIQNNKTAKGETGEYNAKDDIITLVNKVSLVEDGHYIEGSKLTYNLKTKIAKIVSFNQSQQDLDAPPSGRVRVLIPD